MCTHVGSSCGSLMAAPLCWLKKVAVAAEWGGGAVVAGQPKKKKASKRHTGEHEEITHPVQTGQQCSVTPSV